jgi:hypothetical protein
MVLNWKASPNIWKKLQGGAPFHRRYTDDERTWTFPLELVAANLNATQTPAIIGVAAE